VEETFLMLPLLVLALDVKLFYQKLKLPLVLLLLLGVLTQPLLPNKIKVFLFTLFLFVSMVLHSQVIMIIIKIIKHSIIVKYMKLVQVIQLCH